MRLDAPGTKRNTIGMSDHDKKDVIHDVEPAALRMISEIIQRVAVLVERHDDEWFAVQHIRSEELCECPSAPRFTADTKDVRMTFGWRSSDHV